MCVCVCVCVCVCMCVCVCLCVCMCACVRAPANWDRCARSAAGGHDWDLISNLAVLPLLLSPAAPVLMID